jgi:hypothetical protein
MISCFPHPRTKNNAPRFQNARDDIAIEVGLEKSAVDPWRFVARRLSNLSSSNWYEAARDLCRRWPLKA